MSGDSLISHENKAGYCFCRSRLKMRMGGNGRTWPAHGDCKEIRHLGGVLDAIFLKMGGLAIPNLFVTYLK